MIIPATASAATAIINFKKESTTQHDMKSAVLLCVLTEKPGKQHKMYRL